MMSLAITASVSFHGLAARMDLKWLVAEGRCLSAGMTAVNIALAVIDALVAAVAFFQLSRLYSRDRNVHCNRQKVFHCLIGAANFGYLIFFVLTPVAKCCRWSCWSYSCGFVVMALPQIVFLATFLLLLSFWVDLCHQATDRVEDEEDEEEHDYVVLQASANSREPYSSLHAEKRRKCCPCWELPRIRSRQKFAIGVVVLICLLTAAFAVLIWIGVGKDNSINSGTLAQIYSDIFAVVILISGGGLAGYGLLLYHKIRRIQSRSATGDLRKVAGMAVVSFVCFSLRAFLVLFTDIPALDIWKSQHVHQEQSPALLFLYYFIGESIPSLAVLWVMRDLPRSDESGYPRLLITENFSVVPDQRLIQPWMDEEGTSDGMLTNRKFLSPNAKRKGKNERKLLF